MARPKIREIEMTPKAEAFLAGAQDGTLTSVPSAPVARLVAEAAAIQAPAMTKEDQAVENISIATQRDPRPNDDAVGAVEPEKKWAAKFRLSTIDLIERRFHEYYRSGGERLSKRDLVETLLFDALGDDERVYALLGPPPSAG